MTEQTTRPDKPFGNWFPEEAREHVRAAHQELHTSLEGLFPPEFAEHRRKARKEMLLAWRSVIDSALVRMKEDEKRTKKS